LLKILLLKMLRLLYPQFFAWGLGQISKLLEERGIDFARNADNQITITKTPGNIEKINTLLGGKACNRPLLKPIFYQAKQAEAKYFHTSVSILFGINKAKKVFEKQR